MKRRFQKLNRGLLLGGISIVLTASYVGIDNYRFSKSKPQIEEFIKNYVNDVSKLNVSNGGTDNLKSESHITDIANFYNKYWVQHSKGELEYFQRKNDIEHQINNLKTSLSDSSSEDIPVSAYKTETNIRQMKIKKNGPKNALITLTLDSTIYTNGLGSFSDIEGINQITYDSENSMIKKYKTELADGSVQMKYYTTKNDVSIYLTESNGKWKIYGADGSWITNDVLSIIDTKTGKDLASVDSDNSEESMENETEGSYGNSN